MKFFKYSVFATLYFTGLSTFYRWCTRRRARILCYHRIPESMSDPLLDVSRSAFDEQMRYLKRAYQPVPLQAIADTLRRKEPFARAMVAVTFDDGTSDWLEHAAPVLTSVQIPATFFSCTGYSSNRRITYPSHHTPATALTQEQLISLASLPGVTIGAHTINHPQLSHCTADESFRELHGSRQTLEEWIRFPVKLFAYPYGTSHDYTETTAITTAAAGFDASCTLHERTVSRFDDPHHLPRMVAFDEPLWVFKVRVSGILDDLAYAFRALATYFTRHLSPPAPAWHELTQLIASPIAASADKSALPPPRVSVIVRAGNVGRFLRDALISIQSQSFPSWETLILDDASTDTTQEIAQEFVRTDRRFRLIRSSSPLGRSGNANLGILLARGEFIAILDGDDVWSNTQKLAHEVSVLDQHPQAVLVTGGFERVNAELDQTIDTFVYPHADDQWVREWLLTENVIPHSGVLYRTAAAKTAGGYSKHWHYTEDYELWLKMGLKGAFIIEPTIRCKHRFHRDNISKKRRTSQILEELRLIWHYRNCYPHSLRALKKRMISLAGSFLPAPLKQFIRSWYRPQRVANPLSPTDHSVVKNTNPYTVVQFNSFSEIPLTLRDSWNELCSAQKGAFFQSPFWTETWWKHFGQSGQLHLVFALDHDQNLCAVFPGMLDRQKKFFRTRRILQFIGHTLNDFNDIPCRNGHVRAVSTILTHLALSAGAVWDVLELGELPEHSMLLTLLSDHEYDATAFIAPSIQRPLLQKTTNADTAELPSLSKADLNNHSHKLSRIAQTTYAFSRTGIEAIPLLNNAISLNAARAYEAGITPLFRTRAMKEFFQDLLSSAPTAPYWVGISTLTADTETIACALTLHEPHGRIYFFNTFNPAFAKFSPAGLLMRELLRDFFSSKETVFDFGRGAWPYKLRFATTTIMNFNAVYAPTGTWLITLARARQSVKNVLERFHSTRILLSAARRWIDMHETVRS